MRQNLGTIKLVKIDVEGYELEVLRGSKELLLASRPVIWIEHHPTNWDFLEMTPLIPFQFEIVRIPVGFDSDFVQVSLDELPAAASDYLIIPKEKFDLFDFKLADLPHQLVASYH